GFSEEQVLGTFLATYFAGLPDDLFVVVTFERLLGRDPAPDEFVVALKTILPSAGRAGLVTMVTQSTEFRSGAVGADYVRLLHRGPSSAELVGWVFSGLDLTSIAVGILSSTPEFAVTGV